MKITPRAWELNDDYYQIWSRVISGAEFWFESTPSLLTVWKGGPLGTPTHHWHRRSVYCGWCEWREMPAGTGGIRSEGSKVCDHCYQRDGHHVQCPNF